MVLLHNIVLVFFVLLMVYSLFFSYVFESSSASADLFEGMECNAAESQAIAADPIVLSKMNSKEIEELKKRMDDLTNIKSRVDNIDAGTKQNTEGIKKLADEAKNAGSDALGGYDGDSKKIPKVTGL
jgi:G3E family GTPase